jgi:hypothetical protein
VVWVTPARRERIFRMQESFERSSGSSVPARGRAHREVRRLPGGGNLCRRKLEGATGMKQGRKGAVEEGVRRLRKPADAAQPGEVNPVLVATAYRKRRGAGNSKGGRFASEKGSWHPIARTQDFGPNSERERKGKRGRGAWQHVQQGDAGDHEGRTPRIRGVEGQGGSTEPMRCEAAVWRTLEPT